MSTILRHKAPEYGIDITKEGYVRMEDLLAYLKYSVHGLKDINFGMVKEVVDTAEKNRF